MEGLCEAPENRSLASRALDDGKEQSNWRAEGASQVSERLSTPLTLLNCASRSLNISFADGRHALHLKSA